MRLLFSFVILVAICSCSNNANDKPANDSTKTRQIPEDSSEVGEVELTKEDFYTWKVDNDEKTIRKNTKLGDDILSVDTLLIGLNEMYPKIKLEKIKQSHDTLYTLIKDANYLTEQMGSSGSEAYLADAIINLTSANGVKYVKIDFEMGSHAMPGIWSRNDFKDYKEIQ